MDGFYYVCVAAIAVGIVIAIGAIASKMHQNKLIADAIIAGVDPTSARYAIIGETRTWDKTMTHDEATRNGNKQEKCR